VGAKPNLLLLPGLACDERMWRPQLDHLAGQVGQAVVADLAGADSMAALAASALAQAPAGRFALAGLSMGGYVALEIMRQAPERVLGLALLDTSARPDTVEATANRRKAIEQSELDYEGVIDALIPRLILPAKLPRAPELIALIKDMARRVGRDAFVRQQTAIIGRIDSRPDLDKIACPTLVLCGRDDVITPLEVHEEMVAAIRGARHLVIEQCGHLSTLDAPAKVSAALQSWLVDVHP
jgi:pimeloyl-ACP methyl ester carboxylesterase